MFFLFLCENPTNRKPNQKPTKTMHTGLPLQQLQKLPFPTLKPLGGQAHAVLPWASPYAGWPPWATPAAGQPRCRSHRFHLLVARSRRASDGARAPQDGRGAGEASARGQCAGVVFGCFGPGSRKGVCFA